jgi:hypothetical protein
MAEEGTATKTGARTDAASMIAELWAEREQGRSSGPQSGPQSGSPPASPARPPTAPRPPADPRQRALAVAIALLLIGGMAGVVAKTLGFVGAPSKATFVAEADAVCTAANGGVNAIPKPVGYPSLANAASTFVTTTDTQLARLRALDLPGGSDRGEARAVLRAMTATTDAGRNLQAAAGATDASLTAAASRALSTAAQDAGAQARAYGLNACAVGMQPGVDTVVAGANGVVKDDFLVRGNRLCIDFIRATEAVPAIRNANDLPRFVNEGATLIEKLVVDLRAIPVAPGDEATVTELIAIFDTMAGKVRELGPAAAAGDLRRINAIEKEVNDLEGTANGKFEAYGLTGCGSTD